MKIKVLSLNTWMGGILWEPCSDFVIAQQADIILLQEIYSGTDPKLTPRFRSKLFFESVFPEFQSFFSAFICDLREKEGPIDNGNLILSRWSMVETETMFFDKLYTSYDHDKTTDFTDWPAGAQRVVIPLPTGYQLQIVNIHGPVWLDGAEPTARRRRMVAALNGILDTSMPTIIVGDSNATPDNPCWQIIASRCASVFHDQPKTTFNMQRKNNPGYATAAVDVFLKSPEIHAVSARCLNVDISDHLPLVVELEIC